MARKLKSFSRPKGGSLKKSYDTIIAKRRKGALEIQFNRPDRLNTINEERAEDIMHAMDSVELDRNIIAVVLSGDMLRHCPCVSVSSWSSRHLEPCHCAVS